MTRYQAEFETRRKKPSEAGQISQKTSAPSPTRRFRIFNPKPESTLPYKPT